LYFLSFTSWIQAPETALRNSFPHLRANQVELLVPSHFACSAKTRASREILALLCILTTLGAKLKSPIPNLSELRVD
jgi:hypothetical protein